MGNECTCMPCTYQGGSPTVHLDCCMRSGIVEYDHDCPESEHREMAERQFPSADRIVEDTP